MKFVLQSQFLLFLTPAKGSGTMRWSYVFIDLQTLIICMLDSRTFSYTVLLQSGNFFLVRQFFRFRVQKLFLIQYSFNLYY